MIYFSLAMSSSEELAACDLVDCQAGSLFA